MQTRYTIEADGTTTQFAVLFPFLDRTHVKVMLDGVQVEPSGYTWVTNSTIAFSVAPGSGTRVTLYRDTPSDPLTIYQSGSVLTRDQLEVDSLQALYRTEEAEERSLRISADSVAEPLLPTLVPLAPLVVSGDGTRIEMGSTLGTGDLLLRADLSQVGGGKGAELVSFQQTGTGAAVRTLLDKARERVSVLDFGAIGDGVADDTAAINAALSAINDDGVVIIPSGVRCFVAGTVSVPDGCTLMGDSGPWRGYADNASNFYSIGPALHLGALGKVALNTGSSIADLVVIRAGLTFPVTYAAASAWTGIGIEALGDNFSVIGCSVFGFGTGISSVGRQRMRIENVQGDCWNGIYIEANFDTGIISDCHFWPFLTAYGTLDKQQYRRNNGYYLKSTCDWTKLDNNFCYGYLKGYTIDGPDNVTLVSCSADNLTPDASYYVGSVGFSIINGSGGIQLIGCQAAAQETGVSVSSGAGNIVSIIGGTFFASRVNGILHTSGDLVISGNAVIRGQGALGNGIHIASGSARMIVDSAYIVDYASPAIPINAAGTISGTNVQLGKVSYLNTAAPIGGAGSYTVGQIASAGSVTLPANGDVFLVTGTTNIGNFVTNVWAGRKITLIFSSGLTLVNSVSLSLAGNVNAVVTANSTMSFVYNSGVWYETSRGIH